MKTDILVVGAGYAGSVVAERLASAGKRVHVLDKRKMKKGKMEMPMTSGPSLGLLLLPAPALLVPVHRAAEKEGVLGNPHSPGPIDPGS